MKLTWLGQAGYLLKTDNGMTIMIDPYMSDALHNKVDDTYMREVPVNEDILNMQLDVMIITHPHEDHMDFETLDVIFKNNPNMFVLAAYTTQFKMRAQYKQYDLHYMLFDEGAEINIDGVKFTSTFAMHCDGSIGCIVEADGKTICHTGDSMLCRQIRNAYPKHADAFLVPVNGKGNNMTAFDAAKLAAELYPKNVFPMHWDMFKKYGLDVNEFKDAMTQLNASSTINIAIPEHYKEIEL